ncbi:MAG TPA: glycosyltransferase [Rhodopila sp.]|nr:glycosyltransferase [Rhodopila sp.]
MRLGDSGSEDGLIALARSAFARGQQALAANDDVTAVRWLDRAHRLVPRDSNAALTLASACLALDPVRAAGLFAEIAETYDVRQAWVGLAAARLNLAGPVEAAGPLACALSRHALAPETVALADRIAAASGHRGWCGLGSDGTLTIRPASAGPVRILLDGKLLRGPRLPRGWEAAARIEVLIADTPLLGSPIQIDAIRFLAGCLEAVDGRIEGWVWHPRDPDTDPILTLTDATGRVLRRWQADDAGISVPDAGPLARPRAVRIPADWLRAGGVPFHVRGLNGSDVPGSPLIPAAEAQAHVAAALHIGGLYRVGPRRQGMSEPGAAAALLADAQGPDKPVGADGRPRAMTIVIPVHNGGEAVGACLNSVLATAGTEAVVLVIDDGSRDPAVIALLDDLARRRAIRLIRHPAARGFPASANAGILAARGRDVVLLNSDTLVPPGWLERLRATAYGSLDVGTVTPLSNDASILSYPGAAGSNGVPDQAETNRLDALAERANGTTIIDIPVGVGFCLYLRRDCLNAVGLFRADLFAQGYGEESDFCLRARRLGWRNVALTGLFVGHLSGHSFGRSGPHLRARNTRVIERLHPGYQALVDAFLARDPLAEPRRRIDATIWRQRARAWRSSVILITHDHGGGVEQRLLASAQAHAAAGRRPVILRPAMAADGSPAIAVRDGMSDDLPNLVFKMPAEMPALLRFLRAGRPCRQEVHHLLGYHPAIHDLMRRLDVPHDVHVHDYAWFCPRVVLVSGHGRYCGEPDLPDCESCVADHGHFLAEDISVGALRQRSADFLKAADAVFVPSDDAGTRLRRHFPNVITQTVLHADDSAAVVAGRRAVSRPARGGVAAEARPLVCLVGAIGVHKGYDVLLACARDAARRDLDLGFVVVGHTIDDARLLATGRVFITGSFKPSEAARLILEQNAGLGFVPSVCPETWCLGLGDLWQAGLPVVAFDIGAPAERIRRTGRGFLLPLGLPAGAINNALVAGLHTAGH